MDKRIVLERLIEENNGYLLTSIAVENSVTKPFLARYVKKKPVCLLILLCLISMNVTVLIHLTSQNKVTLNENLTMVMVLIKVVMYLIPSVNKFGLMRMLRTLTTTLFGFVIKINKYNLSPYTMRIS